MATRGQAVTYQSYDGANLTLTPWVGQNVAVLTASSTLAPAALDAIVAGLDSAYGVYALITSRAPAPFKVYEGRLSIAEVPTAFNGAGAALGYLGSTGIEITTGAWNKEYNDVASTGRHDQALFYELGRNFWFYQDQLGRVDEFVTGFAIANRFVSMEVAGLAGSPFNGTLDFGTFKTTILDGLAASYFGGATYTLANTLLAHVAPANSQGWGGADFAAALLHRVDDDFGLAAYTRFYTELGKLGSAATADQSIQNLITAASRATGIDYGFLNKASGVSYLVGSASGDQLSSTGAVPAFGFAGDDTIQGSAGADRMFGGDGRDYLRGAAGDDLIVGGSDFDDANGNQGNDTVFGGAGDDWVVGGQDQDLLHGDEGFDIVYGNLGADTIFGDAGNDWVRGGQGDDVVDGGEGNDWLWGDRGNDTITGGAGADLFHSFSGAGIDRITDFSYAQGDRIILDDRTAFVISQVGSDAVITIGGVDQVILVGVTASGLGADAVIYA